MNPKYSPLFQPYTLNNNIQIKNRLAVAPLTHWASNPDGSLSENERLFLSNRANDIGLFILAATIVSENGGTIVGQPQALNASNIPCLKERADIIKKQGAKAILQLHHGGRFTEPKYLNGKDKISASDEPKTGARAATKEDIEKVIKGFANATDLAIQAGYDGVEIHGANNYLIQQFYSGHYNRRDDEWGGSREKRMRFPLAVIDAVNAVKDKHKKQDFIVGYRFSPEEPEELGLTMEDTFELIDKLITKPLQYLHVSLYDFFRHPRRGADTKLYRIQLIHERIKGKLPLIGVGSLYTAEQMLKAFETGWAEFIGLGRTVMINPTVASLIKEGKENDIVTELDPKKEDQYGIKGDLWDMCLKCDDWLPPVKGKNFKNRDV